MKSSTRDEAEGLLHQAKGAVKEAVGKAADDESLQTEGKVERGAGKAQEKVADVKRVFDK